PFLKAHKLPINSDFYFNKNNFGILIYTKIKNPIVIKFIQSDNYIFLKEKLLNEVSSLTIASKINHKTVHTSKVKDIYNQDGLFYFEQELLIAKDLHFLPKSKLEVI